MKPLTDITFAVAGHGQAGSSFCNALAGQSGVNIRWVVGRRSHAVAAFAKEHNIPCHSTEYASILMDPEIDVVLICTPNEQHFEQAMLALQAGKHVVVEVPMAIGAGQARELTEEASRRNRHLSISHNVRFVAAYQRAKELVSNNEIGRIYQVIYRRLISKKGNRGWTNQKRSWTDSVTWHHTAHAADLVSWLLNEPLACKGAAIGRFADHNQSTDVGAVFTTPSHALATLILSYNSRQPLFDCTVIGERGTLEVGEFRILRHNGKQIFRDELDPIACLESAYEGYVVDLLNGLRGQGQIPTPAAEILPTMEQLQLMHDLAGEE